MIRHPEGARVGRLDSRFRGNDRQRHSSVICSNGPVCTNRGAFFYQGTTSTNFMDTSPTCTRHSAHWPCRATYAVAGAVASWARRNSIIEAWTASSGVRVGAVCVGRILAGHRRAARLLSSRRLPNSSMLPAGTPTNTCFTSKPEGCGSHCARAPLRTILGQAARSPTMESGAPTTVRHSFFSLPLNERSVNYV